MCSVITFWNKGQFRAILFLAIGILLMNTIDGPAAETESQRAAATVAARPARQHIHATPFQHRRKRDSHR
jgi:hypothetical protein